MKKIYTLVLLLVVVLYAQRAAAQYTKPAQRYESNWQLNAGIGYGTYYGDMSRYTIRNFSDIGYLRNFLSYNKNYIKEPSFHLSVVKRLGLSASGIGLNFNRTLIQGSDRYINMNGQLQTNDPNFSRSLNFKTDILDAGLSINLNAFSKGFFTPYLTFGAGFSFFDVRGDLFTGPNQNEAYTYTSQQSINDNTFETKLRDELTETDVKYPNTVFYAQGLLGFNFRLSNNFSLAVESDVKYSGSDYLDDLSGTYKTSYPNQRSQYIAKPGNNISTPQANNRGRNDGVNDFYIQNRIVFRFHIPKYLKRSEVKKMNSGFNAPVLYPNNYFIPVDSAAYAKAMMKVNGKATAQADILAQRRMQDSLMMRKTDSVRADSIRKAQPVNVKMDSAFTNELKALRQEVAGLRQTIDRSTMQKKGDSIATQRITLKDSLNQNLQKLQQKKRKTATDSLQQQIYQLRLDSIALAEKYAVRTDTVRVENSATVQSTTAPNTTVVANSNTRREDSLQRVIDSLHSNNTRNRPVQQPVTQQPVKMVRSIRDTLSPMQTQQYQQQVAGLAYRSRQANIDNKQLQNKADSISSVNAAIRTSDSLKVQYYQRDLALAQQQEADIKKNERRGLLVKKSDALKTAEANSAAAQAHLQTAQAARQQNEQNTQVATGDTTYITNLRTQLNARQVEIDSLKKTKKVTDVFTDKNKHIKELEQQQQEQQRQIDDANRMLQYYRTTGPTSYYQPQNYPQTYYPPQTYTNYDRNGYRNNQNPPVNVVSPVVVSGNNDERSRMQREIDSLRNQVTQLQQTQRDTILGKDSLSPVSVMLDSTYNRPINRTPSAEMAALQMQLAELNNRLNATNRLTVVELKPVITDTVNSNIAATVYFSRGSVVLTSLQNAKLAAMLKKAKKNSSYNLIASSDNTTGNKTANDMLARKRAAAVTTYMRSKGITAAHISSNIKANNGLPGGKTDPLARRVDVIIQ